MDLNDIFAVKQLVDKNVEKMHAKLNNITRDSDVLCKDLEHRCVNVSKGDPELIGLHDALLSSMNSFNECVIKWNMHIDLYNLEPLVANIAEPLQRNDFLTHTNKDGIVVDNVLNERSHRPPIIQQMADSKHIIPIDRSESLVRDVESTLCPARPDSDSLSLSTRSSWLNKPDAEIPKQKAKPITAPQPTSAQPQDTATVSAETKTMLPLSPRQRILEPPKGGKTTSSSEIYHQIVKNIAAFPEGSVIKATLMHLNIAEKCFFVGMWDAEPLEKLFEGKLLLKELDQLPNFGEIFAVYDCMDGVILRVIINDYADGGGYYGYLIDFGEHIHMNGDETIFALPDDIRLLPAEAIRCFFKEGDVSCMAEFRYTRVPLCVLEKSGDDLIVELADDNANNSRREKSPDKSAAADSIQDQSVPVPCQTTNPNGPQLSEADLAMLNEIDEGTSDPLKAVLGFRPKDEQRICRHYDPKLNGCFKGSNCRLVHESFAPHGATKDLEVVDALPETEFDTPFSRELGSIVKILVTHVSSTTEVYAQIVDGSPPLVWTKNDVLGTKIQFKQKPHMLDIVLARYNDGCYYRAQIIEESDCDYKIFYVDYGNTEFVPLSALVPCWDVDRIRPHRAVSCYIEGVIHKSSLSPRKAVESMEYIKSKILNVEEDVVVVSRLHDGFEIRFLGDNANLPEELMKRGYAQPDEDGSKPYDSDLDQ